MRTRRLLSCAALLAVGALLGWLASGRSPLQTQGKKAGQGPMEIQRTGIILNTRNYEACVAFYRDLFGLEVLFQKEGDRLTCFDFMGCYLMVETEGTARPEGKSLAECPHKLRFNVTDIDEALAAIRAYGIEARIERFEWGSVINVHDPDGNRVGIREDRGFGAR